jgi:shikimate kinase
MTSGGHRRFRNILMAGLPGVGKSTFGKVYAQMSRTEFVELDKYVEKLAGKSVTEIFAQDGEASFRALEAQCLERLLRRQRCTIALGGGTLSHPESLALAKELGCIVLLTAPVPVIAERLWPSKNNRPLLADCRTKEELAERLQQLLDSRQTSYSEADIVLETSFSSADTLKIELGWLESRLLSKKAEEPDQQNLENSLPRLQLRPIPVADVSYRSPREQKSGKELNDRMERLLKAQRHKDRSDRRERPDKKDKLKKQQQANSPRPVSSHENDLSKPASQQGPVPLDHSGPRPASQGPAPRENSGPRPASQGPAPRENSGPRPASQGPAPRENSGPRPASQGPSLRENSGPRPASQGPSLRENSGPKPASQGPVPRENSGPRPASQGPVPRENSSPKPVSSGPVPRSADASSAPAAQPAEQVRQDSSTKD